MGRVKESDKIALSCANVWLGDDGIMRLIYLPDSPVNLAEAKEVGAAIVNASKGETHPLFSDTRGLRGMSREARNYYASEEITQWTSATAVLNTPITIVIASFFTKFNKPPYPIQFFYSETEAIKWLKEFLVEDST